MRKEIIEIFEIETIFLDFLTFAITHGELLIETLLFRDPNSLVYMEVREMKLGMVGKTKNTLFMQRSLSTANIHGNRKNGTIQPCFYFFLIKILGYYIRRSSFTAIMASIEECVIQPNVVLFAFRIV